MMRKSVFGVLLLGVMVSCVSCGVLYGIDIEATPTSGSAPLTVSFVSDTDGYVGIIEYYWNFDDGEISREEDPTHTFTEPGVYSVTCEATNDQTVVSTSVEIHVTE